MVSLAKKVQREIETGAFRLDLNDPELAGRTTFKIDDFSPQRYIRQFDASYTLKVSPDFEFEGFRLTMIRDGKMVVVDRADFEGFSVFIPNGNVGVYIKFYKDNLGLCDYFYRKFEKEYA